MKAGHPKAQQDGHQHARGVVAGRPQGPSPEMDESLGFRDIMITSITTDGDDDDVA